MLHDLVFYGLDSRTRGFFGRERRHSLRGDLEGVRTEEATYFPRLSSREMKSELIVFHSRRSTSVVKGNLFNSARKLSVKAYSVRIFFS